MKTSHVKARDQRATHNITGTRNSTEIRNKNKTRNKNKKENLFVKFIGNVKGEFGMSSIIGIAIGLIVAAFILIPGIQTFAGKILTDMQLWWTNSISTQIFPN